MPWRRDIGPIRLFVVQHPSDRRVHAVERRALLTELFSARRGDGVVAGAPARRRLAPLRGRPSLLLYAIESRVERSLLDVKDFVGQPLDMLADGVAVHGLNAQRAEHEHFECAGWN